MVSLAAQTNAIPLPSVPEVFGVRLPSSQHVLTQVNFDLVPNKPPPTVKQYDEEIEEIEEDESDEELMDDDQMMAIDEQLTEVFKASASGKKKGTLTPLPTPIPLLTFD